MLKTTDAPQFLYFAFNDEVMTAKSGLIWVCADKEAYGRAKKEYEACGEVDGPEYKAGFCRPARAAC